MSLKQQQQQTFDRWDNLTVQAVFWYDKGCLECSAGWLLSPSSSDPHCTLLSYAWSAFLITFTCPAASGHVTFWPLGPEPLLAWTLPPPPLEVSGDFSRIPKLCGVQSESQCSRLVILKLWRLFSALARRKNHLGCFTEAQWPGWTNQLSHSLGHVLRHW